MEAVDILNRLGRWLVPYLGRVSLELAILADVVLLAVVVLRLPSARLRHTFWGLLLAKPVVTLLIASPFSLYWFLQPPEPASRPAPLLRTVVAPAPQVEGPAATSPARATSASSTPRIGYTAGRASPSR